MIKNKLRKMIQLTCFYNNNTKIKTMKAKLDYNQQILLSNQLLDILVIMRKKIIFILRMPIINNKKE